MEARKAARAATASIARPASTQSVSSSQSSALPKAGPPSSPRRVAKPSFLVGEHEYRLAEAWSPCSCAWELPSAIDQVSLSLVPAVAGKDQTMLLVNCGTSLFLDLLSSPEDQQKTASLPTHVGNSMFPGKSKVRRVQAGSYMVPLPCKVQFRKQPTCHMLVDAPARVSSAAKRCPLPHVLVGFSSGDVVLYNPWWRLEQARHKNAPKGTIKSIELTLNRGGCIEDAAVTALQWMPGHEGTRVLAAFMNGSLLVLSLQWEDPAEGRAGRGQARPPPRTDMLSVCEGLEPACFSAWWAPRGSRVNPMCKLQLSDSPLWQLCFAPDKRTLAVACQDGYLRVVDLEVSREEAVAAPSNGLRGAEGGRSGLLVAACEVAYRSYYGGFTAVSWSKDMRYLVSGGEDDLVSVWSYPKKELLARGKGHTSWVSSVAVDTPNSSKDRLRFFSGGLDCRVLVWEFSPDDCKRPRASSSIHRRPSRSQAAAAAAAAAATPASGRHGSVAAYPGLENSLPMGRRTVPAKQRRQATAILPVGGHKGHGLPVHGVYYDSSGAYITLALDGEVRLWLPRPRPPALDLVALLREHSPARGEETEEVDVEPLPEALTLALEEKREIVEGRVAESGVESDSVAHVESGVGVDCDSTEIERDTKREVEESDNAVGNGSDSDHELTVECECDVVTAADAAPVVPLMNGNRVEVEETAKTPAKVSVPAHVQGCDIEETHVPAAEGLEVEAL